MYYISSAWITANAGSGKTYKITQRFIRILLSGVEPDKIVCLTYTRAAALEMKQRIINSLSELGKLSNDNLKDYLRDHKIITENTPKDKRQKLIAKARSLFFKVIDLPSGLRIHTIHSFCESLLRTYALEIGISPFFRIVEEAKQEKIFQIALSKYFTSIKEKYIDDDLKILLGYTQSRTTLINILRNILIHHPDLLYQQTKYQKHEILTNCSKFLGGEYFELPEDILKQLCQSHELVAIRNYLENFKISSNISNQDQKLFTELKKIIQNIKNHKLIYETCSKIFLTKSLEPRKKIFTKKLLSAYPTICSLIDQLKNYFIKIEQKIQISHISIATNLISQVAKKINVEFESSKIRQNLLSYNDLINLSTILLDSIEDSLWIQYRLNYGINHLMIDEAQDTSTAQWTLIIKLTEKFFDLSQENFGSIMAVGDSKQSIYSFQGANPQLMHQVKKQILKKLQDKIKKLELLKSYRTNPQILKGIDKIFNHLEIKKLITPDESLTHLSARDDDQGGIEIWPLIESHKSSSNNDLNWLPKDTNIQNDPDQILADAICKKISGMIQDKIFVPRTKQPAKPEDFLILVQQRGSLVKKIYNTLRQKELSVTTNENISLNEHLICQDILALFRFIIRNDDDLSLACFLRSPFCEINNDDLEKLCHERKKNTLWQHIKYNQYNIKLINIVKKIDEWLIKANILLPFDFLSSLFANFELLEKLEYNFGADYKDYVNELINHANMLETEDNCSYSAFVRSLEETSVFIKKEQEEINKSIRILTVHGAKGLEAPIVFLADSSRGQDIYHDPTIIPIKRIANIKTTEHINTDLENTIQNKPAMGFIWRLRLGSGIIAKELGQQERNKKIGEYYRLLYVGMTRAADLLIICGIKNKSYNNQCWYNIVSQALLKDSYKEKCAYNDLMVSFYGHQLKQHHLQPTNYLSEKKLISFYPHKYNHGDKINLYSSVNNNSNIWENRPASSHRYNNEIKKTNTIKKNNQTSYSKNSKSDNALELGTLVHNMISILIKKKAIMNNSLEERKKLQYFLTTSFMTKYEDKLLHKAINIIEIMLANQEILQLLKPPIHSELPFIYKKYTKDSRSIYSSGRIDAIKILPEVIQIIDFKTDKNIPINFKTIPNNYIRQLSLYATAIKQNFTNSSFNYFIIWCSEGKLMKIPNNIIE